MGPDFFLSIKDNHLCLFTAKDLKGDGPGLLLIANPFLNLSPYGVAYGTNGFYWMRPESSHQD
jgi:hypothetical protein